MKNPSTISSGESDERAVSVTEWIRNNYQDHTTVDSLCDALDRTLAALATQPAESKACASVGVEPAKRIDAETISLARAWADWLKTNDAPINAASRETLAGVLSRCVASLASPAPSVGGPARLLRSVWDVTQAEQDAMGDDQWSAWKAELRAANQGAFPVSELLTIVEEMQRDALEVYNLPETSQDVRDAIEYCASWMTVYIEKRAPIATPPAAPATGDFEKLVAETWNDPGMAEARAWAKDTLTQAPAATEGASEPFAYYIHIAAEQRGEFVCDLDEALDDLTNCECKITELFDHAAPAAAVPESELIRASNAGYAQGLIDGKALAAVGASVQPAAGALPPVRWWSGVVGAPEKLANLLDEYSEKKESPRRDERVMRAAAKWIREVVASVQPVLASLSDTQRLDALRENSWDLRCIDVPTGGDDSDIHWRVVEHHMTEPHERDVGRCYSDEPRDAIDDALASSTPTTPTKAE